MLGTKIHAAEIAAEDILVDGPERFGFLFGQRQVGHDDDLSIGFGFGPHDLNLLIDRKRRKILGLKWNSQYEN